jgi:Spy/CpxP family protein refolding chaperone
MKTIRFRLLVATLTVCLGSAIAKSQTADDAPPPPPMHGPGFGMDGGHMLGFFAKQLNLTEDQKTQMHSIMQKERPTMKPLFEQAHQIDLQLRQLAEGTLDTAKVQTLATQKAQIQSQLTVSETRIHSELYQVLTAEQQTQLKQLEAEHEARMQSHMQQHQPPSEE